MVAALPPACSDCACLSVVPDKQRLCTPVVGSLTSEATALTLLRISFHCHFSSLQLTGGSPAIANSALYNSQEVCALESHGLVAYIFMPYHSAIGAAGNLMAAGQPTSRQGGLQEAGTHGGQQTLKNMTGSLFKSKIHLHNTILDSKHHHHFDNWIFYHFAIITT